ncbi:RNA 2',3'-cyclic phosphodiesterase [Sulfolobus acidocaldarius]|uniref:RNA 2',3'-cyclic phosphodiesterase n=4 Tax=Sulfolobus acidocaldarius TaxID=2285 RepID=Q4J9A2_SULAC|nr:RNA 2',3'-cyclic phosphodiesterase [Sulfolobus acidocaldarius]AAY80629.1 2',5' RNA ligase [Sulfolobus acidocaldarius DSM 639]AGE71221.1 2'-5' RNA ligase [Sulfolobus acidocaldarius N8]AGE73491.1 2'-5' RNA ligase [Sulfolobus acidocaldarius Ron12/I]ALU28521.1 2'-5' RNA ligase [Sulfolobus acidocaldarius]ALU31230.1 2'-5' RNA ligase [Sulfolobus acidocaldarius]
MLRLFTGINVPNYEKINELMQAISRTGADIKLVEPWNIHITLVFIGEVHENKLELIKDGLKRISFNKFKVRLHGTGAFPSLGKPRVVWVGIDEGAIELRMIRGSIYKELVNRGIRPDEEKEFSPHLTIGRVRGPRNMQNLIQVINEYQGTDFGEFTVEKFTLYKSTLTQKGPIYEPLLEVESNVSGGESFRTNKT